MSKHTVHIRKDCLQRNCGRFISHDISDLLICPFEDGSKESQRLFSYFLHNAPGIESIHSQVIPRELHDVILGRMLQDRHFMHQCFCSSNARIEKKLELGYLSGSSPCLKCKRFVCKRKQTKQNKPTETDLDCFLRHIRNAIAHGRVFYSHAGNRVHIVFEDMNKSGKISARIVCIQADLAHWKHILGDARYYPQT